MTPAQAAAAAEQADPRTFIADGIRRATGIDLDVEEQARRLRAAELRRQEVEARVAHLEIMALIAEVERHPQMAEWHRMEARYAQTRDPADQAAAEEMFHAAMDELAPGRKP
jgi:hypothetical protein